MKLLIERSTSWLAMRLEMMMLLLLLVLIMGVVPHKHGSIDWQELANVGFVT
jgi:hypothetical protein